MKVFCWQKSCIIIPPFRFHPTPPYTFEWQTDGIFPKVKYYDKLNVGQWREKANCCTCSAAANWTWTENPLKCVFNFVRTRETLLFIFQFGMSIPNSSCKVWLFKKNCFSTDFQSVARFHVWFVVKFHNIVTLEDWITFESKNGWNDPILSGDEIEHFLYHRFSK